MAQIDRDMEQTSSGNVSERVVSAVADARGLDPLELPPLYDVIDPDALDQLFDSGASGLGRDAGRVTFGFADCEVVVHGDGAVDVTAARNQGSAPSVADPTAE